MLVEHIKRADTPFIIICAKDGTKFQTLDVSDDTKICFDDKFYTVIAEKSASAAIASLSLASEAGLESVKETFTKDDAIAALNKINLKQ